MALKTEIKEVPVQPWNPRGPLIWELDIVEEGTGKSLKWVIPKNEPAEPFLKGLQFICMFRFFGEKVVIDNLCREFTQISAQ